MKCEICGEESVYQFSPDLDIKGLGGCEKHKQDMQEAYIVLLTAGKEAYKAFLNSLQKAEASKIPPKRL